MKIYIDAGHGGGSIGATYKGRNEQDDCLFVTVKGDVDGDGKITAADSREILRDAVGLD